MSNINTDIAAYTDATLEEMVEAAPIESADTLIAKYGNVSKAIRALDADGYSRGAIAKMLNKRYQHVRNVLITPIKKA